MSGNGKSLLRSSIFRPSALEEIMRPWSEWLDDRWPLSSHMPAVNVKESEKNYEISLAAPGLEKNDFKIDVNGSTLTVSAEKDEKKEEREDGYSRKEYNYRGFSRSFSLPEDILKDKIDANYKNGELVLTLPKKEEAVKTVHQKISVH
ncbi:MAG: Hsp20/alpha crystallin family protein [Chitinophagia bacterium]|jgi:HSP20 family protein|nr:Hsp20/alpha crystallin family protein [Chitinophagia bacterium]